MSEFAIGRYGTDDWRLLKYDETSEIEIESGWSEEPTMRECASALMEHHGAGDQPFSSREGTLDSLSIAKEWPIPVRDMTLSDETMPWSGSS